jgi:hypothetical protein
MKVYPMAQFQATIRMKTTTCRAASARDPQEIRLFDGKKAANYLGIGRKTIRKMVHDRQFRTFIWARDLRSTDSTWIVGLKRKIPAVA